MKLYLTKCGRDKKEGELLPPDELYKSDRIERFVKRCKKKDLDWAILSAEHGLFFPNDNYLNYDSTLKSENYECKFVKSGNILSQKKSRKQFQKLKKDIRKEFEKRGYDEVIFYAQTPVRAKCYLLLIHKAIDNCNEYHKTIDEIKKCIRKHKNISIVTKLESIN